MKFIFPAIAFILLVASGCSSGNFKGSEKFEAALNMKIRNSIKNGDNSSFGIIIKFSREPESKEVKSVEASGITLETVTGKIATATGNAQSIVKLAEYDFIEQVQLAKQNFPNNSFGR